jgi:hypothetical protein
MIPLNGVSTMRPSPTSWMRTTVSTPLGASDSARKSILFVSTDFFWRRL